MRSRYNINRGDLMDIQDLRYFMAVVRYKNFSQAAEKLFVTQPVLTRCVQKLEKELGVPLILRSTKSFALTDAGKALAEQGHILLHQHTDLYRKIQDISDGEQGEICLSAPGVLLDIYFPKLVTQFRKENPGLRIMIRECGSRSVVEDVLNGEADIGLGMLPLEESDQMQVYPVSSNQVHVVVRKGHPLADMEKVPIVMLKDADIITLGRANMLYFRFLEMCRDNGFTPTVGIQSMMSQFLLDVIADSDSVGILPAPMLQQFPKENLVSVPLEPELPWEVAMIVKKDRYVSRAAKRFLAFAQDFWKERE